MVIRTQKSNAELLRESLDFLPRENAIFADRFFERVFTQSVRLRELFGRSGATSYRSAFTEAVRFVASNYANRSILLPALRDLGARHAVHGPREEDLVLFGECLLEVLAEFAGPRWTQAMDLAWRTAFEDIAELMSDGASAANHPTAP